LTRQGNSTIFRVMKKSWLVFLFESYPITKTAVYGTHF
jgi:hypothetical protein